MFTDSFLVGFEDLKMVVTGRVAATRELGTCPELGSQFSCHLCDLGQTFASQT